MTKRERKYHKRKRVWFENRAGYLWPGKKISVQFHMKDGSIYQIPATISRPVFTDHDDLFSLQSPYRLTVTSPAEGLFSKGKLEFDPLDQIDAE